MQVFVDGEGNLGRLFHGYSQGAKEAMKGVGERFLEIIDQEFEQGGPYGGFSHWAKYHPMTLLFKTGKAMDMLQETGEFRKSWVYEKLTDDLVWVGSYHWLAPIHEFGKLIIISDKMRAMFAARGFPLRKETRYIFIKVRQVFTPAYEQLRKEFPELLRETINNSTKLAPVKAIPKFHTNW